MIESVLGRVKHCGVFIRDSFLRFMPVQAGEGVFPIHPLLILSFC